MEVMEESVDEMASVPSLEMTRNPFESLHEEKIHFPSLTSPSVFKTKETPVSDRRRKEFRWSIEQISRLNPADIDENPNQEFSSTFDREEDELKAQQAIDEFFSQEKILPSPWTPKSNGSIKHVTFSPNPPETAYIRDASLDSSYSDTSSCNNSTSQNPGKVDAECQTKLTLPPDFDLFKLLGPDMYSYQDDCDQSMSMSSLRRKLFSQGESSPVKTHPQPTEDHATASPIKRRSILASPNNRQCTSSPVKDNSFESNFKEDFESSMNDMNSSPSLSPIRPTAQSKNNEQREMLSLSKDDFLCESSVFESSDIQSAPMPDLALSPITKPSAMDCEDGVEKGANDEEGSEKLRLSLDDGGPLEMSSLLTSSAINEEKPGQEKGMDGAKTTKDKMKTDFEKIIKDSESKEPEKTSDQASGDGILKMNAKKDEIKNDIFGLKAEKKWTYGEGKAEVLGHVNNKENELMRTKGMLGSYGLGTVDDEVLMVRAQVALKRAEQILNFSKSQDSGIQSLTGVNTHSSLYTSMQYPPGQPVGMSTPMVPIHHHGNNTAWLPSFKTSSLNMKDMVPSFKQSQNSSMLDDSTLPEILKESDLRESSSLMESIDLGGNVLTETKPFLAERQSLLCGANRLSHSPLLYKTPSPLPREKYEYGESLTWPVTKMDKFIHRPVLIPQVPPPAKLPRTSDFTFPVSVMDWQRDRQFKDWKERIGKWEKAVRGNYLID